MIPQAMTILAIVGLGTGAALKPEIILPDSIAGRIVLGLLLLSTLVLPVVVAYRLRTQIDRLHDEFSAIPDSDRQLILKLRVEAGKVTDLFTNESFLSGVPGISNVGPFRDSFGALRHYPQVYRSACKLADLLCELASFQGSQMDYLDITGTTVECYDELIAECGKLLRPSKDLPPSTASEQAPPP